MNLIHFENTREIKRTRLELEKLLKVKISIDGGEVTFEGEPTDEYAAEHVLDAMSFGFSMKKAVQLKDPEMVFRKINIKDFTRRKNLHEVRARIIGTEGKTKRTIEHLSGCEIMIKDHHVGIICSADTLDTEITAIINLIKGSKQANVYRYLEGMNRTRKSQIEKL